MLSPLEPLLKQARAQGRAVGSFNAVCVEFVDGIVAAAQELGQPVTVALSESHLKFIDMETFLWAVRSRAERASVPVSSQFDHAQSIDSIEAALKQGFPSVMFDGKDLDYEEKVRVTAEVVRMARAFNAVVEAPLGTFGSKGKEVSELTDPDMVQDFVDRTGIDILAVSIGTTHGLSAGEARLDLDRLEQIASRCRAHISLHGGSGVPDADYPRAVRLGVNKISIFTRLSQAAVQAVREVMDRPTYRYPDFLPATRAAVGKVVRDLMVMFSARWNDPPEESVTGITRGRHSLGP